MRAVPKDGPSAGGGNCERPWGLPWRRTDRAALVEGGEGGRGVWPDLPAMGYRCVCTTGAVQHKAEVQSKSQRGKLFSDMS